MAACEGKATLTASENVVSAIDKILQRDMLVIYAMKDWTGILAFAEGFECDEGNVGRNC